MFSRAASGASILDEKHHVRHRIEDRFEQREMRKHARQRGVGRIGWMGQVVRVSQRVHLACPVHPVQ
jgi:hypothetical protein